MSDKTSYPLCWPDGWPRTERTRIGHSRFARELTIARAVEELDNELGRLGADKPILSTNVALTLRGSPSSNGNQPKDSGIAVYFKFRGKDASLACDLWLRVQDNIWAVSKHIEALRGQERWGVGTIEQAFRGYMQIPERTSGSAWWNILGVAVNATPDQIGEAYRRLAKHHHPDTGGDTKAMAELNLAYAEARKQIGQ